MKSSAELAQLRAELVQVRSELDQVRGELDRVVSVFGSAHVPTSFEMLTGAALLAEPRMDVEPLADYLADADLLISRNSRTFRLLEWAAERRSRLGDQESVLNLARAAGDWASSHHPGTYASMTIEAALVQLGQLIDLDTGSDPRPERGEDGTLSVLHVLTEAHAVGGHTRLASNWMLADAQNRHSVVLTEQGARPVPEDIVAAAAGRCQSLTAPTPFTRMRELAALARPHDVVVLHVHPYDAVAVAAMSTSHCPPSILVDHGDHVFWLGARSCNGYASLRDSGREVLVTRRNVEPDRVFTLPLPLRPQLRTRTRQRAQDLLGVPAGGTVLLTLASAHKYTAIPSLCFVDEVGDVLSRHESVTLIAVGPEADSAPWHSLSQRYGQRVRVVSATPDVAVFLEAADIYLDSFPFGSLTSMFEAALLETPVVSLRVAEAGPMALDDPFTELPTSPDLTAWHHTIDTLIENPSFRTERAATLSDALRLAHSDGAVAAAIARGYSLAMTQGRQAATPALRSRVSNNDAYLAYFQERAGLGRPAEVLLASYGLLPASLNG